MALHVLPYIMKHTCGFVSASSFIICFKSGKLVRLSLYSLCFTYPQNKSQEASGQSIELANTSALLI